MLISWSLPPEKRNLAGTGAMPVKNHNRKVSKKMHIEECWKLYLHEIHRYLCIFNYRPHRCHTEVQINLDLNGFIYLGRVWFKTNTVVCSVNRI